MTQYGDGFTTYYKNMPTKTSLIEQAEGMETLSESYGEAGDEAESLAGKIKDAIDKQVEANKLAELKSNGFKSWIDELNGILRMKNSLMTRWQWGTILFRGCPRIRQRTK